MLFAVAVILAVSATAYAQHDILQGGELLVVETHVDEAHEAGETGLPQLNVSTYSSQIFWLIISFVLLYILMSKMALPRVSEVLELRESEINGNLERAEKFQTEIDEVKANYEDALAKAHADAADVVKKIEAATTAKVTAKQGEFGETARDRLAKSEANIQKAKDEALKSLEDIAADITKDALKKVANITIKKDEAVKAVQKEMKEVA